MNVDVFHTTLQKTGEWLRDIRQLLEWDTDQRAYLALRAVLHTLRDRLPVIEAVHLGSQLPMLVRGFYYEGWHMAGKPTKDRSVQEFASHVQAGLPPQFPVDPLTAARGVLEILWEKLDPGEFTKVMKHLPEPLRSLGPEATPSS